MMHDVHARRRASQKRAIEPLEVLAHQPARQEVVGLDRLARRIDHAPIADPAVARRDGPVIEADPVTGLVTLRLERVQGQLPAGVVQKEVVGLRDVVNARARRSRLDHVDRDVNAGWQLLARRCDHALERAGPPWS